MAGITQMKCENELIQSSLFQSQRLVVMIRSSTPSRVWQGVFDETSCKSESPHDCLTQKAVPAATTDNKD